MSKPRTMKRYSRTPDGMTEDDFGGWVRYSDVRRELAEMTAKMFELKDQLEKRSTPKGEHDAAIQAFLDQMGWDLSKGGKR